jgi:hypothetical protein
MFGLSMQNTDNTDEGFIRFSICLMDIYRCCVFLYVQVRFVDNLEYNLSGSTTFGQSVYH